MQLKVFNDWWDMIFKMPKSGLVYQPAAAKPISELLKDGADEAQKKIFNEQDGDMDDKLNAEETATFLKNLMGGETADLDSLFFQRMQSCLGCLDSSYGDSVAFDDFNRFKQIVKVLMNSPKLVSSMD